jgi:hypothetical protein
MKKTNNISEMVCTGDEIGHFIKKFTPSSAPRLWVVINVTILLYSILVLCLLAFTHEGLAWYDALVVEWYLTYDVIVCIVWLVETSLRMMSSPVGTPDDTSTSDESPHFRWSKLLIAEWLMAIYFVFDAVSRSRNKSSNGQEADQTISMELDVSICAIAYVYILYVQYKEHEEKLKQGDTEYPSEKQDQSGYQML